PNRGNISQRLDEPPRLVLRGSFDSHTESQQTPVVRTCRDDQQIAWEHRRPARLKHPNAGGESPEGYKSTQVKVRTCGLATDEVGGTGRPDCGQSGIRGAGHCSSALTQNLQSAALERVQK
ncbi:hypothetical protein Bbelb_443230, partial [Branchiostoma belcheri]